MQRIIKAITPLFIILAGTGVQSCKKTTYNFSDGYTNATADTSVITVDTSDSKPDYSMYSQARVFPGLVGDTVPRLQNYPVTINLNYLKNPSQLRIAVLPKAWLSTGMYEPTGEPVAVDVPAGVYGLTAQIGCWTDDLNSIDPSKQKRYPIVYTTKQLFPGRNYIRSPFGGPIYITTTFAQNKSVNLVFSGAVKMPNFVLNASNDQSWIDSVKKIDVPWVELIAPHIILTVNRSRLIRMPVTNATQLMQLWDDIIRIDYNQWEGLSENAADPIDQAPGLPWRCVADIQPVVGYAHNGYPVVYTDDDHWFKAFMTYATIIQSGSWGIIHELGHNNQQTNWSWSGLGETTNNLFSFKAGDRLGFNPQSTIWGPILAYAAKDDTSKNFIKDLSDDSWAIPKCCFFVQLFDVYGYGLMTELYKQTRRAVYTSNNDVDRIDFTYEVASKYANVDLLRFFNQWGLYPSVQAQREIVALPPLAKEVWLYNPGTKSGGDEPIAVNRALWKVLNYDSEHAGTGYAVQNMFDGDSLTFWNTEYSGSKPPYPHYVTVDMGGRFNIKGFSFLGRANNQYTQNPALVDIYVGNDPSSLTKVVTGGSLDLLKRTYIDLPGGAQGFRYFKIVFTIGGDASQPVCNESEVNVY